MSIIYLLLAGGFFSLTLWLVRFSDGLQRCQSWSPFISSRARSRLPCLFIWLWHCLNQKCFH